MGVKMDTKYIFVTGGVVSGLGKGITAASLGRLLKARGLKVALQKMDPYMNIDPSVMSPYQHGEVFVTEDGAETDLDIGHYERFTDVFHDKNSNCTAGRIYYQVLNRGRSGGYGGSTVQVIPHVTNEIKDRIMRLSKYTDLDVVITEIGGTVGDMESLAFIEAIRQMRWDLGHGNCLYIHVTLVPYLHSVGELKTKPTQHSVKELLSQGIQPDIVVCRTETPMGQDQRDKLSLFCNVEPKAVVENVDSESLFEVPLMLHKEGFDELVCQKLQLPLGIPDLYEWEALVARVKAPRQHLKIGLIGNYVELHDAYLSAAEALNHGAIATGAVLEFEWLQAADIVDETPFQGLDGILVPGSLDEQAGLGHKLAARYARQRRIPYLGLCAGFEAAVQELLDLSSENCFHVPGSYAPCHDENENGPVRLGAWDCHFAPDTQWQRIYGQGDIRERHRHANELKLSHLDALAQKGLLLAGTNPDFGFAEAMELEDHPFYLIAYFHPEFKSRPNKPHPVFSALLQAMLSRKNA